jgi:hypothetical protein
VSLNQKERGKLDLAIDLMQSYNMPLSDITVVIDCIQGLTMDAMERKLVEQLERKKAEREACNRVTDI